jgi:hypothetical protein
MLTQHEIGLDDRAAYILVAKVASPNEPVIGLLNIQLATNVLTVN